MTDRKPKGSSPAAPQPPANAQSTSPQQGGTSKNGQGPNAGDSAPTQSIPRVNNESQKQSPQGSTGSPNPSSKQSQSQPPPASKQQKPKTAGEIAAETPPGPPPPPANPSPPQQQTKKPAADGAPADVAARTARLRLARIDPWSVMKVSFALSIALAIVTVIAISIVWFVLGAAGVWDAVNSSVASVLSDDAASFDITEYVGYGRVIGFALLVSAVDVVLITAIATLGAFLYNLAASLLGGLELTLAEDT